MTGLMPFLLVMLGLVILMFYVSYKASQQEAEESKNNTKTVRPAVLL
jgi:uncharacterized membrane protein